MTNNKQHPPIMELQPMLAPNELLGMDIPLTEALFPKLCSIKYNGIRAMYYNKKFYSRSGKEVEVPVSLAIELAPVLDWADNAGVVLDGELNSTTYNTVGETMSILAQTKPLPDDFRYKIFYILPYATWNKPSLQTLEEIIAQKAYLPPNTRVEIVQQFLIRGVAEFESLVEASQYSGQEGFMLINPFACYNHGRTTVRQSTMLKYKYYGDKEDAKIIGIYARRERMAGVESKIGVQGLAEQVHKKGLFQETDIGGSLLVQLEKTKEVISCPFPKNIPLATRRFLLSKFNTGQTGDLLGRWVCFQRLACENRGKPIAIKNVEFRDAKD